MSYALPLADVIIPGLPKLIGGALVGNDFKRQRWAQALNRAQEATEKPCKIGYVHASAGHYDIDGCFRPFGGPMIFTAWCECGRFKYEGMEELGRRAAVKAHKAWATLAANDVVKLHWSRPELDGSEWVIVATNNDQVTLEDIEWGNRRMTVHRAQVDPAGRRWVDKTCDCPRHCRRAVDGRCMAYGCKD